MELQDFTQKFAECFNQTNPAQINADTEFKNLEEWGSMLALIVIAMVDADFGKTVTSEDLKAANTVSDLYNIVSNK